LATQVAGITKPTPAAFAVNRLYRDAPGEIEALFTLGAEVRDAQKSALAGGGPRVLANAQRAQREAVATLVTVARSILERSGATASEATLDRVAETLTTVSTMGTWGEAKPGRLARELAPLGLEALADLLALPPSPQPRAASAKPPASGTDGAARKPAPEREADGAPARKKRDEAAAAREAAERRREADRAVRNAEMILEDAKAAEEHVRQTADEAARAAAASASALSEAQKRAKQADEALTLARRAAEEATADLRSIQASSLETKRAADRANVALVEASRKRTSAEAAVDRARATLKGLGSKEDRR
jgi:hypothetical protein